MEQIASAIYNEVDPFAGAWLRSLIAQGHIAQGVVDERSIADLQPADVAGPGQRHFFAGIGGWSHAARIAGVPDDADVWTGSCPCQGLSDAGKRLGALDPRHLWPAWFRLILECRPPAIFGEQVASRLGLDWLDLVRHDLEGCGYSFGASDLCASSVGAPHIRQRLYFVAYARQGRRTLLRTPRVHDRGEPGHDAPGRGAVGGLGDAGRDRAGQHAGELPGDESQHDLRPALGDHTPFPPSSACGGGGLGDAQGERGGRRAGPGEVPGAEATRAPGVGGADGVVAAGADRGVVDADRLRREDRQPAGTASQLAGGSGALADAQEQRRDKGRRNGAHRRQALEPQRLGVLDGMADPAGGAGELGLHRGAQATQDLGREPAGPRGQQDAPQGALDRGRVADREGYRRDQRLDEREARTDHRPGLADGCWSDVVWLPCSDGVSRPAQSLPLEMVDGLPDTLGLVRDRDHAVVHPLIKGTVARPGRLKGYGNAIVPQLAAAFIQAAEEARDEVDLG